MKIQTCFLLAASVGLGCTTKQNSALVITKVIPPTATVGTGTPPVTTCSFKDTDEVSYLLFNPAENAGTIGVEVTNSIVPTNSANPLLSRDTSTFLPHEAVIDYEVLLQGAAGVGRQVSPVSGTEVSGGSKGQMAVIMFPKPSDVIGLAAGTFIRTTFHINGKLLSNSAAHTSEREYLFRICHTAGCAANPCL